MPEEIIIHGGVIHVTDASIIGQSRFNHIKAEDRQKGISVHFRPDGIFAPGPREALLVAILSGVPAKWLMKPDAGEEPMRIDFEAVSAEPRTAPSKADGMVDVFHMTTVKRNNMTRLHLSMTNQNKSELHGTILMSKGQVTQMIASLLVLYEQLHED